MIYPNESFRYILHEEVAIEDFDEGSLVFLCNRLELIEINKTAKHILGLLNGKRKLIDIIQIIANDFGISEKESRGDTLKLVEEMGNQGVLIPAVKQKNKGRSKMNKKSSFLTNPDVSLREENGDGAILFNADTDASLIINPVGQLIWKFLIHHPRTRSDIIKHIKEMCDNVPSEQVQTDVDEFLNDLFKKGFIGEVVDEKK